MSRHTANENQQAPKYVRNHLLCDLRPKFLTVTTGMETFLIRHEERDLRTQTYYDKQQTGVSQNTRGHKTKRIFFKVWVEAS